MPQESIFDILLKREGPEPERLKLDTKMRLPSPSANKARIAQEQRDRGKLPPPPQPPAMFQPPPKDDREFLWDFDAKGNAIRAGWRPRGKKK